MLKFPHKVILFEQQPVKILTLSAKWGHPKWVDPLQRSLDQIDRYVDVAASCVGIRAQLVRRFHQRLSEFALQTRQADVETGREGVSAAGCTQVHFRVDCDVRRESDLLLAGGEL